MSLAITVIDTQIAPVECVKAAAADGDLVIAAIGMAMPIGGCAKWQPGTCTLILPVSAGPGQLLALLGTLMTPDVLLAHEFRHCRDGDYHPAMLPHLDLLQ